jgi:hypothetical protein
MWALADALGAHNIVAVASATLSTGIATLAAILATAVSRPRPRMIVTRA